VGRILAVTNAKGGVGKTSTVANLGAALALEGKSVLLVDFDSQGSLTWHLGYDPDDYRGLSIYEAIIGKHQLPDSMIETKYAVHLVPANLDLSAVELDFLSDFMTDGVPWQSRLRQLVYDYKEYYDFVLIDTGPSFGVLTINALVAAEEVIIPLSCDYLSMRGLGQLMGVLRKVKDRWNQELTIAGVLATMYDGRTKHSREVLQETRKALAGKILVFDTVIRKSVKFQEAPLVGEPITVYDPGFWGSKSYRKLAQEVIDLDKKGR